MLGRFILQVQMKTRLEVHEHECHLLSLITAHCWLSKKRNSIVRSRSALQRNFLVESLFKKNDTTLKYLLNEFKKVLLLLEKCKQM